MFNYAVINCIPGPPLPRQLWGSSGDLLGDLQNIVSPQTRGLCGEIFRSKQLEIFYPGMSAYAGTLTKGAQGYGAGTYPGIYKQNVPRSPGQTPGLYLGQSTNLNPWASPRYPPVVGAGVTIDSHIINQICPFKFKVHN